MKQQEALKLKGNIVDVIKEDIYPAEIYIEDGKIISVKKIDEKLDNYILPGLIDAHVHIESSMMLPSEFAKVAVSHGTTSCVSDPHEIANVLGVKGVEFMIENASNVPFNFYFGAPSCVPATPFETSGAVLGVEEIDYLLKRDDILYLGEMMNFPGVIYKDKEVIEKLNLANKYGKRIDGHAPGLSGEDLKKYAEKNITSDHECFTIEEAKEKLKHNIKVQIREGSAAKNFDTLIPLISEYRDMLMFCSDDKHPDELMEGHINLLVKKATQKGYNFIDIIKVCTLNPTLHYNLPKALLQEGDNADLIIVDDIDSFKILQTYIGGVEVFDGERSLINYKELSKPNNFNASFIKEEDIRIKAEKEQIAVIGVVDGQLITEKLVEKANVVNGNIESDIDKDILKIIVKNRYSDAKPIIGFIKGFKLKSGAIASTVAHDSHNIIAVGCSDKEIVKAVNLIIESKGGISAINNDESKLLRLEVAGIMSSDSAQNIAKAYKSIDLLAKKMGSTLDAPYMTLSFMALLVIPSLKIGDKYLFDGDNFKETQLFV